MRWDIKEFDIICVDEMITESEGEVSSGEGGVFSSTQRCLQEDRQKVGVESSSILWAAAPVTQGIFYFVNFSL